MKSKLSDIFVEFPRTWGLRGEEFLWEEFKKHFEDNPPEDSVRDFRDTINSTFEKLTGHPIHTDRLIYIEKYNNGGVTGGMVDPNIWRNNVRSLLIKRYLGINY